MCIKGPASRSRTKTLESRRIVYSGRLFLPAETAPKRRSTIQSQSLDEPFDSLASCRLSIVEVYLSIVVVLKNMPKPSDPLQGTLDRESDLGRPAKLYSLTPDGRKQIERELKSWNCLSFCRPPSHPKRLMRDIYADYSDYQTTR